MITLRRATDRQPGRRQRPQFWRTFAARDPTDSLANGFGALEVLDEDRLSPCAGIRRRPPREAEIITYVRYGALAYHDLLGRSGVVQGGEFLHLTAGAGLLHGETNASTTDWAQVFQLWLRPARAGLDPVHEHRRFSLAQRRNVLCAIASADARRGSFRVHQDAGIYATVLDPGHHLIHELAPGRTAWLHIIEGAAVLNGVVLGTGDGAGITGEHAVSLTAKESTELLLIDLGEEGGEWGAGEAAAGGERKAVNMGRKGEIDAVVSGSRVPGALGAGTSDILHDGRADSRPARRGRGRGARASHPGSARRVTVNNTGAAPLLAGHLSRRCG